MLLVAHPAFRKDVDYVRADNLANFVDAQPLRVLCRDDYGGSSDRPAVHIAQGHLALRIRAETGLGAGMTSLGKRAQDRVGEVDRCWHQHRSLAASITKHDALIACALVLVAGSVHTQSDVRRLGMDMRGDLGVLPMKPTLFVADVPHGLASDGLEAVVGHRIGTAHLASEHDEIGGAHRFNGNARQGLFGQKGVENSI